MGQPSLFGVAAREPATGDLAGLLAAGGAVTRLGGTARVSVPVDAAWRVHALIPELASRGLAASWQPAEPGFTVRTAYTARLVELARAWAVGPPSGWFVDGPVLRLWVIAAGAATPDGFRLGLPVTPASWPPLGAVLAATGLVAALVVPTGGAPACQVTGRRRLARLAELVGDPPEPAPDGAWPGGVSPAVQ